MLGKLEAEEDPVVSFTVGSSSDEPLAATCHKSGLVRLWTWTLVEEGKKELKTEVIIGNMELPLKNPLEGIKIFSR